MSIASKVYQALAASKSLCRLLHRDRRGCGIYHGRSPDAGSYPALDAERDAIKKNIVEAVKAALRREGK